MIYKLNIEKRYQKDVKKYKFPLLNCAKIVYNDFKVCFYALKSEIWNTLTYNFFERG